MLTAKQHPSWLQRHACGPQRGVEKKLLWMALTPLSRSFSLENPDPKMASPFLVSISSLLYRHSRPTSIAFTRVLSSMNDSFQETRN
jgi:hypothetical protein